MISNEIIPYGIYVCKLEDNNTIKTQPSHAGTVIINDAIDARTTSKGHPTIIHNMSVESRHFFLFPHLIREPLRLQCQYHALSIVAMHVNRRLQK